MAGYYTTEEWQVEFGGQIRNERLLQNIDQVTLAQKAGIALTALKNLESGKGATLKTLIRTLKTLDRVEWLLTFAPEVTVNPLDMLKRRNKTRLRATGRRGSQKGEE